jgi:hypothetical protein
VGFLYIVHKSLVGQSFRRKPFEDREGARSGIVTQG